MDDDKPYSITLDPLDVTYNSAGAATTTSTVTFNDYTSGSGTGTFSIDMPSDTDDWVHDPSITVPEGADIKIGERSLKTFMDTMEKRMAILQPDPKKLKKFEALQKAYEHYKHLESLCELEDEEGPNY